MLLAAALFRLFGTHLALLRLVPVSLTAVAAVVIWRVGKRTVGEQPALVAALLIWVWPPYLIWKLQVFHGFYASGLVYTALIFLLVLRIAEALGRRDVAVLGLVLGLAFWQTLQIVAVAVPALLWLTMRRPRVWRMAGLAVSRRDRRSAAVAALELEPRLVSLNKLPGAGVPYVTKFHGFVSGTLPMMLGLRLPFTADWILGAVVTAPIYVALVALFAFFAWRWRRTPMGLFATVVLVYPFLYSLSGLDLAHDDPRYVVLLVPSIRCCSCRGSRRRSSGRPGMLAVAVLCLDALPHPLGRLDASERAGGGDRPAVREHHAGDPGAAARRDRPGVLRLLAGLPDHVRDAGQIIVSESDMTSLAAVGPRRVLPPVPSNFTEHHHPAYYTAVRDSPRHAYLLVRGEPGEQRTFALLLAHAYREDDLGPVLVLVSPPPGDRRPRSGSMRDSPRR